EQAQATVVPVRLEGTGALMPPGASHIRPGFVHLHYLSPIAPSAWCSAPEPRAALAALVRSCLNDSR
ncbi:MAG: hypothetical protein ACRD2D_03795, partial [Terriglobales bacterium]